MINNETTSELWQPSVRLRFVIRKVLDTNIVVGGSYLYKYVNILQQLFTSNTGKREWKDIPIESEDDVN